MSYRYKLEDLLAFLYPFSPTLVDAIAVNRRQVDHGLLSVGLKIHCLGDSSPFNELVECLGGAERIVTVNAYRREDSSLCLVLPPVGNAQAAIRLLEVIELATGCKLFRNPEIQIQVCSPGRLSASHSACLAVGFYLGSDILRRYTMRDFTTTFSRLDHRSLNNLQRGKRVLLYDASGDFDRQFHWWRKFYGTLVIRDHLPFKNGRTDVLTAHSKVDIENINLLATLLVHIQHAGYWHSLGNRFQQELRALLDIHMLRGVLSAPWIRTEEEVEHGDRLFLEALKELTLYAFDDVLRVNRLGRYKQVKPDGPLGILGDMRSLLEKYRGLLLEGSRWCAQQGERT